MQTSETPKTDDRPETDLAQRTGGGGDTPPPSAPPRRRRRGIGRSGRWEIALLAGPAVIFFVGFVILPVILAAYYGFFNWHGYGPATDFIGLKNYITIPIRRGISTTISRAFRSGIVRFASWVTGP